MGCVWLSRLQRCSRMATVLLFWTPPWHGNGEVAPWQGPRIPAVNEPCVFFFGMPSVRTCARLRSKTRSCDPWPVESASHGPSRALAYLLRSLEEGRGVTTRAVQTHHQRCSSTGGGGESVRVVWLQPSRSGLLCASPQRHARNGDDQAQLRLSAARLQVMVGQDSCMRCCPTCSQLRTRAIKQIRMINPFFG